MLSDTHGRTFSYLRLSLTDVCNFRCVYCLPHGYQKTHATEANATEPLDRDEIGRLVSAFAHAGMWKVRLTGGEPSVRRDLVEVVQTVAATDGVRKVALSTNGYRLSELAAPLQRAGLSQVNVSVDSFDRQEFAAITGQDLLPSVLEGIDAALDAGLCVKLNAVRLAGHAESLEPFFDFVRARPVVIRFIQLMRTRDNELVFLRHHTPFASLERALDERGWIERPRALGDGPAREFRHADFAGGIGLIAPYGEGFCDSCNRLRITSTGRLRLCLFGDGELDLRPHLHDQARILELVQNALTTKTEGHRLRQQDPGATRHLAEVGG